MASTLIFKARLRNFCIGGGGPTIQATADNVSWLQSQSCALWQQQQHSRRAYISIHEEALAKGGDVSKLDSAFARPITSHQANTENLAEHDVHTLHVSVCATNVPELCRSCPAVSTVCWRTLHPVKKPARAFSSASNGRLETKICHPRNRESVCECNRPKQTTTESWSCGSLCVHIH